MFGTQTETTRRRRLAQIGAPALIFLLAGQAAFASPRMPSGDDAQARMSPSYGACVDAAKGGDRGSCIAREYDHQDARLNTAYRKLSASLDEAKRTTLRNEERQWLADRDKACGKGNGKDVVKNECTLGRTADRAAELEQRIGLAPASAEAVKGDWGYRSDCGSGHYVQFSAKPAGAAVGGTWSDGTRAGGESGSFKGELRDGKLFVRFCSDEETRGGFPLCPAYGTGDDAYFVPVGKDLAWYRTWGPPADGKFDKYVELHRAANGEKVPLDTRCPTGSN
jgi:uncharacterized protein YecT (DUF1311 family)